jgi:hypothetical protein
MATGRAGCAAIELADGRVLAVGGRVRAGVATPGTEAGVTTGTAEVFTP